MAFYKNMKRIIFSILILFGIVGIFLYPWKHEGFFINELGDYDLKGNKHSISVFTDSNGLLNVRTHTGSKKISFAEGCIDPRKQWFIYVDKVNEVWLSHADEVVYIYSFDSEQGVCNINDFPNTKVNGSKLIENIPDEVIERLTPSVLAQINR